MKRLVFLALLLGACKAKPDESTAAPAGSTAILTAPVCTDADGCAQRCASGDRDACFERGNALAGHDDGAATSAFERACTLGLAVACAHAGRMHEYAHGVPKDDAQAFSFYVEACDGGADVGCYNEAVLLEAGRGTARNAAAARDLYARVCRAGSTTACAKAHASALAP